MTVGSITENVHFFTDHVAGAIANPRDLPFSSQSLDLIRQLGKSIGSRCTAKERSGDISTLLLRWAEASHEKKKAIDAVLQNRSDDRLSPEQLEQIQNLLLDQVPFFFPPHTQLCLAGHHLAIVLQAVYAPRSFRPLLFLLSGLLLFIIILFKKQHTKKTKRRRRREAAPLLGFSECAVCSTHDRLLRSNTAKNASCGISTLPIWRMRFLPFFCFSSSLRLREMSPP